MDDRIIKRGGDVADIRLLQIEQNQLREPLIKIQEANFGYPRRLW